MILELCALSADVPASLLDKLEGSKRWTKDIVGQLVKDKMIRRYQKDKIKSLRLTKKGRDILLEADRDRFCTLLDGAGAKRFRKTDLPVRIRQHRLAAVYLLMMRAGVAIHRDEKADIFGELPWDANPASVLKKWSVPCFYSSVEIKTHGEELNKIKGTRAMGALFTESPSPYLVYHTGSVPLKWSEKSEQRISGVVEGTLVNWKLRVSKPRGLMIGDDMAVLPKLLTSDGGHRNYYYKVDDAYTVFNFIPMDQHGNLLLRLLCNEDAKRRINERLMADFEPAEYHKFHCDALDGNLPVLFAWDMDMVKLRSYRNGLERNEARGMVLCMEFQADAMREYFGNLAEIRLLDTEEFRREMFYGT